MWKLFLNRKFCYILEVKRIIYAGVGDFKSFLHFLRLLYHDDMLMNGKFDIYFHGVNFDAFVQLDLILKVFIKAMHINIYHYFLYM